jgi:hypothetical protein
MFRDLPTRLILTDLRATASAGDRATLLTLILRTLMKSRIGYDPRMPTDIRTLVFSNVGILKYFR